MNKLKLGLEILTILNEYSFESYIVGGAVRDYILQRPIEDIDITTSAKPEDIVTIFSEVTKEGEGYFGCRIHYKGYTFEVTTFRRDISYQDHRHPQSIQATTLAEDVQRRDFTMNALAMNQNEEIIDLVQGIEDIKSKTIRMIGNPHKRFNEDALRVLRALDFASRLNFQFDEQILESFSVDYVAYLKEEYILSMIQRITSNPFSIGLKYIVEYQILRGFPFYQVVCEEAYHWKYTRHIFALFYCLHHFLPANLKLSKEEIKLARDIAYYVRNDLNDISLYYGNKECLEDAVELYTILSGKQVDIEEVYKRIKELPIHNAKEIALDWNRILTKNRGKVTKRLESAIINKEIKNQNEEIMKYLEIEE